MLKPPFSVLQKKQHNEYVDYIEKSMLTKETEADTTLVVKDTDEFYGKLSIFGGQRQAKREGYNKFNIDTVASSKYINVGNGVLGNSETSDTSDYIQVVANKSYTLSYDYETLTAAGKRGYCYFDENKQYLSGSEYTSSNKNTTFTATADGYIRFAYDKNCTNIMFCESSEEKPYEQFGVMPSLSYPSKIECVGGGKAELELGTIASATGTNNASNQRVRTKDYIRVISNTECTIDADNVDEVVVFQYDENKTKILATSWLELPYTFTLNENTRYIRYAFRYADSRVLTVDEVKDKSKYLSNIEINVSNKNIFEETFNDKNRTGQFGSIVRGNFFLKENMTYTVSFDTNNNSGQVYINEELFDTAQRRSCNGKRQYITATAKKSGSFIDKVIIKTALTTETAYDISNVQIELSDTNSDFVKHKGKTHIMPIQREMFEKDGFEKIDGVDYEAHNKKEKVITGDDVLSVVSNNRIFFKMSSVENIKELEEKYYSVNNIDKNTIECSIAKTLTGHSLTWLATVEKGDYVSAWNNYTGQNGFVLRTDKEFTKEEAIAYFNENPFTVVYELLETEYIKCTDEQSAILDKIDTYRDGTIITTDNDLCKISLRYKQNLESRIEQIEKQIVGGN